MRKSFSALKSMNTLEEIYLDLNVIDHDLLDLLGDLPRLKSLKIRHHPWYQWQPLELAWGSVMKTRKGKFGELQALNITSSMKTLAGILRVYFSHTNTSLKCLKAYAIPLDDIDMELSNWIALRGKYDKIEELRLMLPGAWPSGHHLSQVLHSKTLSHLTINQHTIFPRAEFTKILQICPNVTHLSLVRHKWKFSPNDIHWDDESDLVDISCLGILAESLPHLKSLELSVLACDTSQLKSDKSLVPFKSLHRLDLFVFSLWNWHSKAGFDQHEAARYISVLLVRGPGTTFNCDVADLTEIYYIPPEWEANPSTLVSQFGPYKEFMQGFVKRVRDYMEKAAGI